MTCALPIRQFGFAPLMMIPLSQHMGVPAVPIVREGEEVARGQMIAKPGGFVSVAMHAPASGIVKKIGWGLNMLGKMVETIYVEPFPGSSQQIEYGVSHPVNLDRPDDIVEAVQRAGLVGLGGAAFPTHVKLKIPEGKYADTILVNGVECEPYLTTDHRVMLEQKEAIIDGIRLILKATGAKRAIIAIEANKPDAIRELSAMVKFTESITIEAVKVKYPQGAEKMLVTTLLGREIPEGGLPIDVHVVVFNVASTAEIGWLLPKGYGLTERVITFAGDGIEKPGNYMIPIGTPLRYALEQARWCDNARQIILGGPMMGQSLACLDVPITKGTSGVLVFTDDQVNQSPTKIYPCIRCGYCVDACPIHLNPSRLAVLAQNREYERMANDHHLMDCFECGCCSYVCPSNIPLVQLFRLSKAVLREDEGFS